MSDFPISCQWMRRETPVCHEDHHLSHLSRWDPSACFRKETCPAQGVSGCPQGYCSALVLDGAPGQPLDRRKHCTASSARPAGWLQDCGMVVHLWPKQGASHSNANCFRAANNSPKPRADFLWQVRVLTLPLSLPFCYTGLITPACLAGW